MATLPSFWRTRPRASPVIPSWTIASLLPEGATLDAAIDVYRDAFSKPPYNDTGRAAEIRERLVGEHARRPGFRALAATGQSGRMIGMAYGYHSERGQWWHDAVAAAISPEVYRRYLVDSFELVEIAVAPSFQGTGVGAALIDHLLRGLGRSSCVLSTRTDSRAHVLYARLGFEMLAEMRFFPGAYPFYVMGKRLTEGVAG